MHSPRAQAGLIKRHPALMLWLILVVLGAPAILKLGDKLYGEPMVGFVVFSLAYWLVYSNSLLRQGKIEV